MMFYYVTTHDFDSVQQTIAAEAYIAYHFSILEAHLLQGVVALLVGINCVSLSMDYGTTIKNTPVSS